MPPKSRSLVFLALFLCGLAHQSLLAASSPLLINLSRWSQVDYGPFEQGPGIWELNPNNISVTETKNADPTILLSDFTLVSHRIKGTIRVDDEDDDDFIGFVFGFQDPRHFYLWDWKQTRQFTPKRGTAEEGMTIKVVNAGTEITRADFWPTFPSNTNRINTLSHNNIPWQSYTNYEWQLDFVPGFFSVILRHEGEILDIMQHSVNTYPSGKFGFYDSSQAEVTFSNFTIVDLPALPAMSIDDSSATEGNIGTSDMVFQITLSSPPTETTTALLSTRPLTATEGVDYVQVERVPVTFAPGETNVSIAVPVIGDTESEFNENFSVHLSWLQNAAFGRIDAIGTILEDESLTNRVPSVEITHPTEGQRFSSLAPINLNAVANDLDGSIAYVDYFNDDIYIGRSTTAPYSVPFQPTAVGEFTFMAVASDNVGTMGYSAPVTAHFQSSTNADIAIVRNFPDPEIDLLQQYLAEMGYTSLVFQQEGLDATVLDDFLLVIWDDLGEVENGLRNSDVSIFAELIEKDIPLYFIGEHLALASEQFDEPTKLQWRALSHLVLFPVSEGNGFISANTDSHPVMNGPFGTIVGFPYPPTMDPARRFNSGEELIAYSSETDVIVAYESPDGLVRTLTQNVLVSKRTPECGLVERERLFKNAIWWLLQEFPPPRFLNLYTEIEQSQDIIVAGTPVTFDITVSHSGELGAKDVTLVNHLPPGMTLVEAVVEDGYCTNVCGLLVCHLGDLGYSYQTVVSITAIPSQTGIVTNIATLSAQDPEPRTIDNRVESIIQVLEPTDVAMSLEAELLSPTDLILRLTAVPGLRYLIESSGNMRDWELHEDFIATEMVTTFTNTLSPLTTRRFYRAQLHSP